MSRSILYKKLNSRVDAFPDWCDKHVSWCLVIGVLIYLLITCWIASKKMLWNDELFTLYLSRLEDSSDILAALSTGADQHPPSFYLLTHVVLQWLGESPLAIRLPEIFAVLLMSLCLFRFVSKRMSTLYGLAAMVFPLITTAYEYAFEARGYALLLGFSGLALLCWQACTEESRRFWWLFGLAASGVAAISSHYYSILLLVPLGAGEIVRSLARRRIDFPIWLALGCIFIPLAIFYPVIQEARSYAAHFWSPPEWSMIPIFYYVLLTPILGPLLATLIAFSLWPMNQSSRQVSPTLNTYSLHEIVAGIGFMIIPAVAIVMGKLITGAFTWRYGLPAVLGFSILCPLAIQRASCGRAIMGIFFTLFSCLWFVVMGVNYLTHQTALAAAWSNTYRFFQSGDYPELPIVIGDLHTFMTLAYYAPPRISSRVVYLTDAEASLRYLGHDTVDRGIWDLKPWFHLSVEEYLPYVGSHDRFLVYSRLFGPGNLSWLLYELPKSYERIEVVNRHEDGLLFLVTLPEKK